MIKATLIDSMGSDLTTVNAARVSFGKKSDWERKDVYGRDDFGAYEEEVLSLHDKDVKLIKYLAEHKHFSPFGHAFASFHVKAPIFVARQLVKHKFLRWNEISRRYVDDEPEFYSPVWRMKADKVKQGSGPEFSFLEQHHINGGEDYTEMAKAHYQWLLDEGVAPEQARMVLPQSTMTEWWWSGSLDAFADMCKLRCKEDTQYETRLVADQISEHMQGLFPVSWAALLND